MKGQWLGKFTGKHDGDIMLNIDRKNDQYIGVIHLNPYKQVLNGSVINFIAYNFEGKLEGRYYPINRNASQASNLNITTDESQMFYSSNVDINLVFKNEVELTLWTNDVNYIAKFSQESVSGESKITGVDLSWEDFKGYISKEEITGFLFRGQQKPWKLWTSFHRRGRFVMSEFVNKDIKYLHQRLSAVTNHFFNLTIPEQNGSFVNLLQHHGYPTPLLDWSYSPYVAAFFAFRGLPIGYSEDDNVRIYVFNNKEWSEKFVQYQSLDICFPHLSVMEFIALDNPRLVPQQSVTTVTNINDIEAYIQKAEKKFKVSFLTAIDIPANERDLVMSDLRIMGITAGSMFPSIDGICEELLERNFSQ